METGLAVYSKGSWIWSAIDFGTKILGSFFGFNQGGQSGGHKLDKESMHKILESFRELRNDMRRSHEKQTNIMIGFIARATRTLEKVDAELDRWSTLCAMLSLLALVIIGISCRTVLDMPLDLGLWRCFLRLIEIITFLYAISLLISHILNYAEQEDNIIRVFCLSAWRFLKEIARSF